MLSNHRTPAMRAMLVALVAVALIVLLTGQARPAAAQTAQRCFPETGQCITGPIRAYWEASGGLPVFGYPVTPQQVETVEGRTLQVQWFERDRLEIQADGRVTAGRLGARFLELEWRPWQSYPPAPGADPQCQIFPETGQSACGAFLAYWRANGGLERFGYPITGSFDESIEGREYQVQYFERRRMELHPELSGSPVLLGLLGNEVLRISTSARQADYPGCLENMSTVMRQAFNRLSAPEALGCPILYPPDNMPAALQHFEHGEMIWIDPPTFRVPGGMLPRMIFAYFQAPGMPWPIFKGFSDTWQEGVDPDTPAVTAPAERYAPWRGFGKVWEANPAVRESIGWAVEPRPQARRADYQLFERGIMVRVYEPGSAGVVYAASGGGVFAPSYAQRVTP